MRFFFSVEKLGICFDNPKHRRQGLHKSGDAVGKGQSVKL